MESRKKYRLGDMEEIISEMEIEDRCDEIVEIEGWDAKAGKLIFHEVYRKEQGN